MKQVNDVEILFDAMSENPDSYQEIVQHQDAQKSLARWPLIASINGAGSIFIDSSEDLTKTNVIPITLEATEVPAEVLLLLQSKVKKVGLSTLIFKNVKVVAEETLEVSEVFTSEAEDPISSSSEEHLEVQPLPAEEGVNKSISQDEVLTTEEILEVSEVFTSEAEDQTSSSAEEQPEVQQLPKEDGIDKLSSQNEVIATQVILEESDMTFTEVMQQVAEETPKEDSVNKPLEVGSLKSALALNPSSNTIASSQSISAIFDRLKRS